MTSWQVVNSFSVSDPLDITTDGKDLFISRSVVTLDPSKMYRYTKKGVFKEEIDVVDATASRGLVGITFDGEHFIVADFDVLRNVLVINRRGITVDSVTLPGSGLITGLYFDGKFLYATNVLRTLSKYCCIGNSAKLVSSIANVGSQGVCSDGKDFYTNFDDTDKKAPVDLTFRINSDLSQSKESFTTPGLQPRGIVFDGKFFWLCDLDSDLVYQLELK